MSTFIFSAVVLLGLTSAYASPVAKRNSSITDAQILQFALTLEHLENTFYSGALSQFDESAFDAAGLPNGSYGRFKQICDHEATHVAFVSSALESLGAEVPQACNYSFPYSDPKGFAHLSEIFEGVGTSAYLGAVSLLQDKNLITASGAILTTEARQNAWVASYVNNGYPWSTSFDDPLTASQAFSLAAGFIVSCPPSNPSLPVTDFPALKVNTVSPAPGQAISVSFNETSKASPLYLALKTGLKTDFVELSQDGSDYTATLPDGLQGTVYAFVTNSNTAATDNEEVTGAAILMFHLPPHASNSQ